MSNFDPNDQRRRLDRRRLLVGLAGGATVLAIPAAIALAHDDDHDDDSSGSGSGEDHDDHDNSGPGNAEDRGNRDDDDEGDVAPLGTVPPGSLEVRIVDDDADGFQPGTIAVDPGQPVTFVNLDDDPHTATGAGFDTGIMQPGQQATVIFDQPGTYPFACQIHPIMTGVVEVRGAVASPAATPGEATPASGGATLDVAIRDFAFATAELSIAAGNTVTWTNDDSVPHTATAEDGSFDTGLLDPGASSSITFAAAGRFAYFCAFHPSMTGIVVVT